MLPDKPDRIVFPDWWFQCRPIREKTTRKRRYCRVWKTSSEESEISPIGGKRSKAAKLLECGSNSHGHYVEQPWSRELTPAQQQSAAHEFSWLWPRPSEVSKWQHEIDLQTKPARQSAHIAWIVNNQHRDNRTRWKRKRGKRSCHKNHQPFWKRGNGNPRTDHWWKVRPKCSRNYRTYIILG